MMNANEIKIAIEWLFENRRYKLIQWVVDNFGSDCIIETRIKKLDFCAAAREIAEYDLSIHLALVELMY